MNRASPADLRISLETANVYARAGIRFVCVPVLDDQDQLRLQALSVYRLEQIAQQAEREEVQP